MKKKNNALTSMAPYIIIGLLIIVSLFVLNGDDSKVNDITTGELITAIKSEKIEEIVITPKSNESVYYVTGKLEGYKKNETFETKVIEEQMPFITETITEYVDTEDIKYETNKDPGTNSFLLVIVEIVPLLFLVVVAYFLFTKLASGSG